MSESIIFATIEEARTSIDPVKLTKAVDKFWSSPFERVTLALSVEAISTQWLQHTTPSVFP